MRALIVLLFLLFSPIESKEIERNDITILQVNAQWNRQHNIDLNGLIGCQIQFAWLEDQSSDFQNQVQTVPLIVIYKHGKPKKQWAADLSFKLNIDLSEIQKEIDRIR